MRVLVLDRFVGNAYSVGLLRGLRQSGVEALLGGPADSGRDDVVPVFPQSHAPGRWLTKLWQLLRGTATYVRLIRRDRPDVVHVQWPVKYDYVYARLAKAMVGSKIVYTDHVPRARGEESLTRWRHRFFDVADAVITHGPTLRDALLQDSPDLEGRLFVVEVGNYDHVITRFDRDRAREELGLSPGSTVFAFVGDVSPRKGVDVLIDAFVALPPEDRVKCELLVVGPCWDDGYLREIRARGGLRPAPRWMVSNELVSDRILDVTVSASDAVVLPFIDAAQSASAIFAMTHGRCVISTSVGEVTRTLSGRGILVPPRDVPALTSALLEVIADHVHADDLGRRARAYALDVLSWRRLGEQTRATYEFALRR